MKPRMNEHKNPPKTIEEVGIHIGYMSDHLTEIKEILKDSPSRKEVDDLRNDFDDFKKDVETNYVSARMFKLGLGVVTTILTVAIGIYTLVDYIKG